MAAPKRKKSNASAAEKKEKDNDFVVKESADAALAEKIKSSPQKPKTKTRTRNAYSSSKSKTSTESPSQGTDTQNQQPAKKRRRAPSKKGTSSSNNNSTAVMNNNTTVSGSVMAEKIGPSTPAPTSILILDNGGDTIKYGWIHDEKPKRMANVTARLKHQLTVLVGEETEKMAQSNPSQLYGITRSTERGIITNMGNQVQVWKKILDNMGIMVRSDSEASQAFGWKVTRGNKKITSKQKETSNIDAAAAKEKKQQQIPATLVGVMILVPPYCPRVILDQIMYVWMEDFGIGNVGFATSQVCATQPHPDYLCGCLVDMGWSATNIVPTFRGNLIMPTPSLSTTNDDNDCKKEVVSSTLSTIRRLALGGKQLVNIWKYYTSYRQWNLMEQDWIMRDVFEQLGYVSLDFQGEISLGHRIPQGRRPYDRNFVLPDYQNSFRGHVELPEQLKRQQEEEDQLAWEAIEQESQEQAESEDERPIEISRRDGVGYDEEGNNTVGEENYSKKRKRKTKSKASNKKKKGKQKEEKDDDDDGDDDNDNDENEDEDDNKEMLRQRLLRQKQEEERRRRELELEQQVLAVSVERFAIPEILFHPSDAGLPTDLAGLPHAIVQSIETCPKYLQPALFRSIQLTGGLSQIPNLVERLLIEIRALVPEKYELDVSLSANPVDQAWLGAKDWASRTPCLQWGISREEWDTGQKRKAWVKMLSSKALV